MSVLKEFRDFAIKGNAIDMAVGVIVGGAFGKIVTSIIEDLVMPVVGKLVGNVDFSDLYVPLSEAQFNAASIVEAKKLGPVFAYGSFITILINFIILAFCIFTMVKAINRLKLKAAAQEAAAPVAPPPPDPQLALLREIRDALRK